MTPAETRQLCRKLVEVAERPAFRWMDVFTYLLKDGLAGDPAAFAIAADYIEEHDRSKDKAKVATFVNNLRALAMDAAQETTPKEAWDDIPF